MKAAYDKLPVQTSTVYRLQVSYWWEKISQTHPFLKVSALKTSKKGGFEKFGLQWDSNPVPAGQDQHPIR